MCTENNFTLIFVSIPKKANILINSENTLIFTEHQGYAKCITIVILGIIFSSVCLYFFKLQELTHCFKKQKINILNKSCNLIMLIS